MRHAGMHWPANAGGEHPDRETIYSLPGVSGGCLLMLADSARFWYGEARQRCPLVVWRGLPRPGKLPADLSWDPRRVATEVLNLWDEQDANHVGEEWFVPLNELQFRKESGEDFQGYKDLAEKLSRLRVELRRRLPPSVQLLFPPFVPQDELERLGEWAEEADNWDGLCIHAYKSAREIRTRYYEYRQAFPHSPIFVGEQNADHTGADEREVLEALAEIAAQDTLFLGATYYIWETNNGGEQDLSVWGNEGRLSLFQDPPRDPSVVEPQPEEPPVPTPSDLQQGIDVSNNNGNIDWDVAAASGITFAAAKITEGTWFRDGWFADNWSEMRRVMLAVRIAYDFGRPSVCAARDEARYFMEAFGMLGCSIEVADCLALDLEDPDVPSGVDLSGWTYDWLRWVEDAAQFKPLVYSSPGYIDDHKLWNEPRIGEYGLWVANWRSDFPPAPSPWSLVAFWQNGVYPSWPGVVGECDHDFFNGSSDLMVRYGKPGTVVAPPDPGVVPPTEGSDPLAEARNLVGLAYNDDGVVLPPLDRISAGKITKAEMVTEAGSVATWLRSNRP
jgi:GH25 family lysozyme M1 (1,4-beta-N-acetylmuramidase)